MDSDSPSDTRLFPTDLPTKTKKVYTPEQKRKWNLSTRYGLTEADVSRMLAEQGNKCAICATPLTEPKIDHCHATGKVRGILCHDCNIKLPAVEDAGWLMLAWAYLDERG